MTVADDTPLHDLPDRYLRQALTHPEHLQAFLQEAVPRLASGFDCGRARLLDRELPLDDWRRRASDLPFEIPYRTSTGEETRALVLVLIEHQSSPDPWMPFRMLLIAALYWEKCWKDWEARPSPRPEPRLPPALPIVFYTGSREWNTNRTLGELLAEPTAFHAFAPQWTPLFWNLRDQTAEGLLASASEWMQTLAVIRSQGEDADEFRTVYNEVVRRVASLSGEDTPRWYDLMRFLLTWVLWRRPRGERAGLVAEARTTQASADRLREVETMSQNLGETLEAWALKRGELRMGRAVLGQLLEARFGTLPEIWQRRIEAVDEPELLQQAIRQVSQLQSLDDLQL